MTKYFDLLRAHQQNKGKRPEDPTSATPDNPYTSATQDLSAEAEGTLIDETGMTPVESVEEDPAIDIDTLPSETTTQAPPATPDLNADDFTPEYWLQHISHILQSVFQDAQQEQATDISRLEKPLQQLMDQLQENPKILDALELEISRNLKQICNPELDVHDLVEKAIMMMLYAIKVCLRLQQTRDNMVHHAMAAMLHHIGMAMVPAEIRQKADKLTPNEVDMIRQAPKKAVAYLKACHVQQNDILLAAEQAAERYDGSGPQGLAGHDIAWVARLVGLLSMFEALIHIRPYRPRLLPRDAIRELVNHHKKAFDPVLLKALIEAVSLYPVGTFVQLNTGEIGQVIQVHDKFPLRPVVYVSMDKHGNPITPREIDLRQQPNLMIQKCMYQESLEQNDEQG